MCNTMFINIIIGSLQRWEREREAVDGLPTIRFGQKHTGSQAYLSTSDRKSEDRATHGAQLCHDLFYSRVGFLFHSIFPNDYR